jgi:hypothetical protein
MAVHVYAKQPLQGSVAEIPKPIPRIANTPRVPRRLLTESGIQELANLVKVSELQGRAPYLFDVLQLYCVAMFGVLRPGYTGLPLPMIFFNSDTLEWHRTVRKILDTQRHIESVQITPSRIKDFLEDFRSESGYSQTLQGTVTLVSFSYEQVVNGIIGGCSGRAVRYRAWVKLSEKPDGFLPLAPSDGEFEINIAGTTQKLKPGELSELTVRHGDTPGGQGNSARLTWTPLNKPPLTAELNLEAVQKGNATEETLHFEFSDLNNTSGLRARITATRAFRQVQRFVQPTSGAMVTERGDASELKLLDGFVDVWMNGFKEKSDSWSGYGLDLQTIRTVPQRVFGRSTSGVSYWVAGAANPGATHLNQTNIWFFSEGAARCLIDTAPVPRTSSAAAGIELFPAAWLSGDSLAKVWYESGRLPSGPDQRDDFGSAQLPPLDSSMRGALPSAVQQGRWLFDRRLPNACYHWEVFFHAPMLIADHLSKQQRFEDAERWLRLVFDPQSVDPATPTAFLRFRVFAEMPHGRSVANDLKTLAKAVADGTTSDPVAESIRTLISRWRNQPFRPFVIARGRPVAFLWRTVFAYLDNLIAWADDLFRRSTRESIAEAALLYVLDDRILGPRPRR